jgi:tRNA uracil 4-sulfurtransferase
MKAILGLSPDITTKAPGTRKRFTRRLVHNLRAAMASHGIAARVRSAYARIHLEAEDPRALAVAQRTFGVHSVMPCRELPVTDLPQLVQDGCALMAPRLAGKTFAVRGRVRDPSMDFSGQRINEQLGAALLPHARKVDLEHPDVTVRVEVRDGVASFFTDVLSGEGGLPVGVGGRALCLLSGGFDSAVAAHLLLRRGVALDFLCLRLGGDPHERAVVSVANHLAMRWFPGLRAQLVIVPMEEALERMRARVAPRYWQLVLKHMMYGTAEAVARRTCAEALVTGESLGQVSTQTLTNLRALDASVDLPVLRPVLADDKNRILTLARHVGTHDLSARVPEYCALEARRPSTGARPKELAEAAAQADFDPAAALADAAWLDLPTGTEAAQHDLAVTRIPDAARVLDLRSDGARLRHPIDRAEPIDALALLDRPETLDPHTAHVIVCDVGTRSAWLAQRLRDQGHRAYYLTPAPLADAPG